MGNDSAEIMPKVNHMINHFYHRLIVWLQYIKEKSNDKRVIGGNLMFFTVFCV